MNGYEGTTSTTADPKDETIRLLRAEIFQLQTRNGQMCDFIHLINETANENYLKHQWCDEYIQIIDKLNESAPYGVSLKAPTQTFKARLLLKARIEVDTYIEVEAKNVDDANDIVLRMIDNDEIEHDGVTYTINELLSQEGDIEVDAQDHEADIYSIYPK